MGSRENLLILLAIVCVMALAGLAATMTKNSKLAQKLTNTESIDTSVNPAADDSDSLATTLSPTISIFPLDTDKTKVELQNKTDDYSLVYTNDHYFLTEGGQVLVFAPPFNQGSLLKIKTMTKLTAPSDILNGQNCTTGSEKIDGKNATKYACEGQIWTYYQLSHNSKNYQLDLSDASSTAAKNLLTSFSFLD